jgi:peptidylprolyl isomerase
VERVRSLARQGFYDGVVFHRVIDGFMAQTGDPTGTGQGGSELPDLKAEFNELPHMRGTVSMARAEDHDSANSQFFIMFQPRLRLDRRYTVFGRVIAGMGHVDAIARGEPPAEPTRVLQASIAADNRPAPPRLAAPAPQGRDLLAAEAGKLFEGQAQPPRE